jgi:hypothetical protein
MFCIVIFSCDEQVCIISKSLVPMLANMMESDKKKRWTFEIFFGEVFKIKDMLPVRL